MNERLFDIDAAARRRVCRALAGELVGATDLVFAYVHGSFLTDQPFHDIDVAVLLGREVRAATSGILELSERLSRAVGYPVDSRALNDAPLSFQFRALQGTLLMVRDDETLANFMERVGRRYLDIAPLLRRATREAFTR